MRKWFLAVFYGMYLFFSLKLWHIIRIFRNVFCRYLNQLQCIVSKNWLTAGFCFWRRGIWRCTHAKLDPQTQHPLARDRLTKPASKQGGTLWSRQLCCPHFSTAYCWRVRTVRSHSPFLDRRLRWMVARCHLSWPAWIVFCFFRCWIANGKHGGEMARSGIGCWVAAIGHLCHSHAFSPYCDALSKQLRQPSGPILPALLGMIGTKLSGVRGCSPIFCRVVITSSRYSWNIRHS